MPASASLSLHAPILLETKLFTGQAFARAQVLISHWFPFHPTLHLHSAAISFFESSQSP